MESDGGVKVLHLLRHAEARHNVEGDVSLRRFFFLGEWRRLSLRLLVRVLRPIWNRVFRLVTTVPSDTHAHEFRDAGLTPAGWNQVVELRKLLEETSFFTSIQLVVVSPMTRTLQTATGLFHGINSVQLIAVESCRERISSRPSDNRSSVGEYMTEFPGVDFSLIQDDKDISWRQDSSESSQQLHIRVSTFLQWLMNRGSRR